ncbi:MAG: hypothetical protein ACREAN_09410, partial [Nitrosopumilaceae archaeon]
IGYPSVTIEEQKSTNPRIEKLLKSASKRDRHCSRHHDINFPIFYGRKGICRHERQSQTTRSMPRYKVHIYSFKKFAFTVMADTLGEIAARAIKGDREYVLTYYRKNREERAADYRKVVPKLSVFSNNEEPTAKEEIEAKIRSMGPDELAKLQEFLKTAKA